MSQKARRHTHKYYRATLSYGQVWACALPECTHFMPQHISELVLGKPSLCWECGEKFFLNPQNMEEDRPRCHSCRMGLNDIPIPVNINTGDSEKTIEMKTNTAKNIEDFLAGIKNLKFREE